MSHFFKISAKTITIAVVYLFLVYTLVYSFTYTTHAGTFGAILPGVNVTKTNVTEEMLNTSSEEGTGLFGGIIGTIVGLIVAGALVLTMGPIGFAIAAGVASIGIGGIGGYLVTRGVTAYMHQNNIDVPWDDFMIGMRVFFGSIWDLFIFICGFLTFNIVGAAGMPIPAEMGWFFFFMTFPIWMYFVVLSAGFAVEAWRSVKPW